MSFSIGQTVRLKSGGPLMTVMSEPDRVNMVACTWFVQSDVKGHVFNVAALEADNGLDDSTIDD